MSAQAPTLTRPRTTDTWQNLRAPVTGLFCGLLVLGLLFHTEVAAAIRTWIDSTAYNHCFLVMPIAAWLIWDRHTDLRGFRAEPTPWACLLGLPVAAAWLAAERLGIMEGRQLMALTFLELLFFAVLGWQSWKRIAGPMLYLYFMVPFGEFLVPKLQDVTTEFVRRGLTLIHIPAYIDGYTIEIPEGTFYIAQACAGLRFLIASIAFGTLYALIMYRSPWRRIGFIVASIIVPVIANGFRALGIVALGHVLGSAQAAATDHVLYGWIFFSLVILLLIALGLPFRQDGAPSHASSWPVTDGNDNRSRLANDNSSRLAIVAAAAVAAVASISPAVAAGLNRAAVATAGAPTLLDPGPGCGNLPVPQQVAVGTAGPIAVQQVACGPDVFDVRIEIFSPRTTAGPVMSERRRQSHVLDAEDTEEAWLDGPATAPRVWRMIRSTQPTSTMAVGLWVDGKPARLGMAMRLHMAWTSLTGTRYAPVLITVAPAMDQTRLSAMAVERIDKNLQEFLHSHQAISRQVRKLAADGGS
jgi:exosortase A